MAVYGGYIISQAKAGEGILFRATQLLRVSMVNAYLRHCVARFQCAFGTATFYYQPDTWTFNIS